MARVLYRYNPETFQYEPIHVSGKQLARRALVYLVLGLCAALPATHWYIANYSSLQEQHLISVNSHLAADWDKLDREINLAYRQLDSLAEKDDGFYRVLLDLPPLDANMRLAGVGGSDRRQEEASSYETIRSNYERIEKLKHQLEVARQSFAQLSDVTRTKTSMLAARPAIQPINKKQLTMLHLTFGMRMHPIFKVMMDHKGLDFTAANGTPVYATADGRVSTAYISPSYGNVVFIDHGFHYETRYAHLQKFNVEAGNFVKRGDLIGYVGNTGISAAPHLHYEVFYKGNAVNPIHFFQRDLSQQEYQKIIRPATP
jgi:murein DD-endopeptidase MepM/ murein hydrolase activator NlpD